MMLQRMLPPSPPRTPALQVGLFAPPEDISAASMLEALYFYALAHQNDFDGAGAGGEGRGMEAGRVLQLEGVAAAGAAWPPTRASLRDDSAPLAVCWPKGTVAETIFTPMVDRIRAAGGQVLGSKLVVGLETVEGGGGAVTAVTTRDTQTGEMSRHEADAVVFAIGITGEGWVC